MRGKSDPTGALVIGLGAGLWFFFKGFRVLREYKVLEDTPRIPVRSVPIGFVHIRGTADTSHILSSPISHVPCCFYKVEIDQWKSSGKSHSWQHICTDMDGYQFHLADTTGKILIDAHAAEYDLPVTSTRVVSSTTEASNPAPVGTASGASDNDLLHYVHYAQTHSMTERVGHFIDKRLEKAGAGENPELQAKRDAFRDLFAAAPAAMKTGQVPIDLITRLACAGGPLKDPEKEQKRQMFLEHLRVMESMRQSGQLQIKMPLDQPATGRFRLREYLVLPGKEYLVDGTCVENSAAAAGQDRSMIAKGENEPTFVVSARGEADLQHGLRKRAALMILGGAALALACLAGLLVHFNMF
jgi:hypothetical protein